MLVYIIGPYSHATAEERDRNVMQARVACALLIQAGHTPICTISMWEGLEHVEGLEYDRFMECCQAIIDKCDCVTLLPGWEASKGSQIEVDYAQSISKSVARLDAMMLCSGRDTDTGRCPVRVKDCIECSSRKLAEIERAIREKGAHS